MCFCVPVRSAGCSLTELQQRLGVREDVLLLGSSSSLCEGIVAIAGKAAGEVAPVVGIFPAGHSNFVAGIQLRNSAQGEQQRKSQLQLFRRAAGLGEEARRVVIVDEA